MNASAENLQEMETNLGNSSPEQSSGIGIETATSALSIGKLIEEAQKLKEQKNEEREEVVKNTEAQAAAYPPEVQEKVRRATHDYIGQYDAHVRFYNRELTEARDVDEAYEFLKEQMSGHKEIGRLTKKGELTPDEQQKLNQLKLRDDELDKKFDEYPQYIADRARWKLNHHVDYENPKKINALNKAFNTYVASKEQRDKKHEQHVTRIIDKYFEGMQRPTIHTEHLAEEVAPVLDQELHHVKQEVSPQHSEVIESEPQGYGAPSSAAEAFRQDIPETDNPETTPLKTPEIHREQKEEEPIETVLGQPVEQIRHYAPLTAEEIEKEDSRRLGGTRPVSEEELTPRDPAWTTEEVSQWNNVKTPDKKLSPHEVDAVLAAEEAQKLSKENIPQALPHEKLQPEHTSGYEKIREFVPRIFHSFIDKREAKKLYQKVNKEYENISRIQPTLDRLTIEFNQFIGGAEDPEIVEKMKDKPLDVVLQYRNDIFKRELQKISESSLSEKDKEIARARLDTRNQRDVAQLKRIHAEQSELTWKYENARKAQASFELLRDKAVERVTARMNEKLVPHEQKIEELRKEYIAIGNEIVRQKQIQTHFDEHVKKLKTDPSQSRTVRALEKELEAMDRDIEKRKKSLDIIGAQGVALTGEVLSWRSETERFAAFTREKARIYPEKRERVQEEPHIKEKEPEVVDGKVYVSNINDSYGPAGFAEMMHQSPHLNQRQEPSKGIFKLLGARLKKLISFFTH